MQCHNIFFPSRVAYIFGRDFVVMTGELNHFFSLFQPTPKNCNGVKSGLCGGQFIFWKWLLTLHSFLTRAQWILTLSSWNMLEPSGRKKIHWWDNLVIQYIQELCWLAVPVPDQLKQPKIITLQFAYLNRNNNFFLARQYINVISWSIWGMCSLHPSINESNTNKWIWHLMKNRNTCVAMTHLHTSVSWFHLIFLMVCLSAFSRSMSGFRPALPNSGFTWSFTWQAYKRLLSAARHYFVISCLHEYWAHCLVVAGLISY